MNFRSENKVKIEGGMSTMTDLVFLLLIFFIVISTLITAGVNIDVPKNGGSSSDKKILDAIKETIELTDPKAVAEALGLNEKKKKEQEPVEIEEEVDLETLETGK